MKISYLINLSVAVFVIIYSYSLVIETPRYSLYMFKKAVKAHDIKEATNYIDIDSIVSAIMKSMNNELMQEAQVRMTLEQLADPIARSIIASSSKAVSSLMLKLYSAAITTPENDKTAIKDICNTSIMDFIIINDEKTATIGIKNKPNLTFRMLKQNNYWKIVQVPYVKHGETP